MIILRLRWVGPVLGPVEVLLLARPSYAGAAVEVLESLDRQLSVRHEGRMIAGQEASPSPVILRNGQGRHTGIPVTPSGVNGLGEGQE